MQTPAEKRLVVQVAQALQTIEQREGRVGKLLNVGAGRSLSIERQLDQRGCRYECDRIDVEDCLVEHPAVRNCYHGSAEAMTPLTDGTYDVALANYVLEHVPRIDQTATEVWRVLQTGGLFVAAIPNPTAPEFVCSRITPLWFHKLIRGQEAWETYYAYRNIPELCGIFEQAGFERVEADRFAFLTGYLHRFPVIHIAGRIYDAALQTSRIGCLLGNVCFSARKPSVVIGEIEQPAHEAVVAEPACL